ncbi:hypothetical protein C8J57DRAFT_1507067 [Mycena rebaudengoi]|nr:hypothetical protein C8J57DRAFT_1507067 [Mycena rebaudengoi]
MDMVPIPEHCLLDVKRAAMSVEAVSAIELDRAASPDFWDRFWQWLSFLHVYSSAIGMRALTIFCEFFLFLKNTEDQQLWSVITETPGFFHTLPVAWVALLQAQDCFAVYYCSKTCQATDWRAGHKTWCEDLSSARHGIQIVDYVDDLLTGCSGYSGGLTRREISFMRIILDDEHARSRRKICDEQVACLAEAPNGVLCTHFDYNTDLGACPYKPVECRNTCSTRGRAIPGPIFPLRGIFEFYYQFLQHLESFATQFSSMSASILRSSTVINFVTFDYGRVMSAVTYISSQHL